MFALYPCELTLCWSKGLSSKGKNVSTLRHDSIELEVKTATRPLWHPQQATLPESTGKEGSYVHDGTIDLDY